MSVPKLSEPRIHELHERFQESREDMEDEASSRLDFEPRTRADTYRFAYPSAKATPLCRDDNIFRNDPLWLFLFPEETVRRQRFSTQIANET